MRNLKFKLAGLILNATNGLAAPKSVTWGEMSNGQRAAVLVGLTIMVVGGYQAGWIMFALSVTTAVDALYHASGLAAKVKAANARRNAQARPANRPVRLRLNYRV